jgi:outer membrane protein TolC
MWLSLLLISAALGAEVPTIDLPEAVRRVEADNPDLAAMRAKVEEARAMATIAHAPMLPALSVTGSYARNDKEVSLAFGDLISGLGLPIQIDPSKLPDPTVIQPLDAFSLSATARVPLLTPSSIGDSMAATSQIEAARATVDAVRLQLETAVVQACALAQAAEGVAEAARRAQSVAEAHRDATKRAVDAGTATNLALLQAEADVVRRQSEVVQAEANVDSGRRALGVLLGMDGPVRVTVPTLDDAVAPRKHPDLIAAQARADAAEKALLAARLRYSPNLSAWGMAAASTSPYVTGDKTLWKVGVDLSWTLVDGGAREGRMAAAVAQAEAARDTLRSTELKLAQATADAESALAVARERLTLATTQRDLAREAETTALRGVSAGTVTALEGRDAEERAFAADVGVAAATAQVVVAQAGLRRAKGVAW